MAGTLRLFYTISCNILGTEEEVHARQHGKKTSQMMQEVNELLISYTLFYQFFCNLLDSQKVTDYCQGECCGNSRQEQLSAVYWALATSYCLQFSTRQHPQGKKEEIRQTDTMAAEIQLNQRNNLCWQQSIYSSIQKKPKINSICVVRNEEEAGPRYRRKRQGWR